MKKQKKNKIKQKFVNNVNNALYMLDTCNVNQN